MGSSERIAGCLVVISLAVLVFGPHALKWVAFGVVGAALVSLLEDLWRRRGTRLR